ncbi:MAG: penicillin-binding protein [Arcanobacterium sp.]|nr:penicillin-binding protein [Arcanobacterium sp.]
MNQPLRKLTAIVIVMFLMLIGALTYIHFFQAPSLNADSRNVRTIYQEYGTDRGNIVVAGEPIADSVPAKGQYKFQRTYADGPLYAPITGYFSVAYNSLTGLERSQNTLLSGSDSSLITQRIQELITGKQPRGGSVALTINPAVQKAAMDALDGRTGAVVAIEPTTGKILALVSSPSFDPNKLASHTFATAEEAWNAYQADEQQPLLNRAIGGDLYPPGSTFKIVTASAMLESGLTPDSMVDAPTSYTLPGTNTQIYNAVGVCGDGSGKATLRTALVLSCNTTFAAGGVAVGAEKLIEKAKQYGFGQDLDIGLPTTASRFPQPADKASLAMDSFGQKDVQASPLQMAMIAAAVANHGTLMKPYLVDQTLTADLAVVSQTNPTVFSQPISRTTADQLTSMMKDVVSHTPSAAVSGVNTAGKTGTAENAGDDHAWYIGFEAAEKSRIAVAVFVEHGGFGSVTAAPIAAQVIQAATS